MDLKFYPMDHGDPRNGDWIAIQFADGDCHVLRWHNGSFRTMFEPVTAKIVGWLPIGYWRPAETIPGDDNWLMTVSSTGVVLKGRTATCLAWQPMPIAPPKKPEKSVMVNLLENVTDADLIAELKRRMVTK